MKLATTVGFSPTVFVVKKKVNENAGFEESKN
jgi:hypothetical protein